MSNEFVNRRNIQWFPGHMAKTLRLIEANLKNVDVVLQLLDARIPLSSLNPELQRLTAAKPRLYVMNKADLADPDLTRAWQAYFRAAGAGCVAISAKQKGLEFKINVDQKIPLRLIGDEMRIKQILVNILNNADKGQNNPYYWVSSTDSYVEVYNSYNKDQHLKKGRDNDDDGCRVRCVRDYRISDE